MESLIYNRKHKWDQSKCSICGEHNTQFVCWRCQQADVEALHERISQLDGKVKALEEHIAFEARARIKEKAGY